MWNVYRIKLFIDEKNLKKGEVEEADQERDKDVEDFCHSLEVF